MGKIIIRDKRGGRDRNKLLWELFGTNEIHPWKIIESRSNFIVIVRDEDIEKIIAEHVRNQLRDKGLEVSIPPEYNSKRTVLIKGIDKMFDNIEERKIKESIENRYPNLKTEEVIKLRNGNFRSIKIKFSTIEMANKVKDKGIIIGNQSFPEQQIEEEIFINLIPCYNCYKYDHKTSECPTDKQVICSNCSQKDHLYKECKNKPKCINCQEEHSTLQAKCKIRKGLIKEEIKKIKQNQPPNTNNRTYAQATSNIGQQQQQQIIQQNISTKLPQNAATTIMTAIIAGHIQEAIKPGSFQNTVDKIYELNGLPTVKLPRNWNHIEVLNHLGIDSKQIERKKREREIQRRKQAEEEGRNYEEEKESDTEANKEVVITESDLELADTTETEREIDELYTQTKKKVKERKRKNLTPSPTIQRQQREKRQTHYTSHESLSEEINLHELNLCIYVPQGNKINIRNRADRIRIMEAYVEGHLKATWNKQEWSRDNIKTLLNNNKERIVEYIKIRKVEDQEYDKTREGYMTN